ncbi:MAG TPA: polyprenyl synthetase family protein [Pseudonocardiaceae bacterium]
MSPALRRTVDQLHPGLARMAGFTFGWLDADGTPCAGETGKGLRPALAVLAAEAVGAPAESAVPGAVAVELVHAFSLVHDDIMDGDEKRRHRDTLWKAFGIGGAVLAGDALLALAMDVLATAAYPRGNTAMNLLSTTLIELVNGQADDVGFEERPWLGANAVTVEEYLTMVGNKTGALLGCAMGLGALLGGGSLDAVGTLSQLGRDLGVAFQAVDDLLGIWGDPLVTGKPVFNDLRQRKKTLPVVRALAGEGARAERIVALVREGDEVSLRRAADLIDDAGGRSATEQLADEFLARARQTIDTWSVDGAAAAELTEAAEFIVNRAH